MAVTAVSPGTDRAPLRLTFFLVTREFWDPLGATILSALNQLSTRGRSR